jgi:hypothetical protein
VFLAGSEMHERIIILTELNHVDDNIEVRASVIDNGAVNLNLLRLGRDKRGEQEAREEKKEVSHALYPGELEERAYSSVFFFQSKVTGR